MKYEQQQASPNSAKGECSTLNQRSSTRARAPNEAPDDSRLSTNDLRSVDSTDNDWVLHTLSI